MNCTCLSTPAIIQAHCALGCEHAKHLIASAALRVCTRRHFPEHSGEIYLRLTRAISLRPAGLRIEHLDAYTVSKLRDVLNRKDEAWGQNRRAHLLINIDEVDVPDPPSDDDRHLGSAFEHLPQHQREVLSLRFIEGLGPREIAGRLGRSEAWVRAVLRQGLDTLRHGLT